MKSEETKYARLMSEISRQEEQEMCRRLEQGDPEIKNEMIERYLFLVPYIVRRYEDSWRKREDLISVGSIGLIKAVHSFDPSQNVRLATYASICIRNEILMYLRNDARASSEVSLDETFDFAGKGKPVTLQEISLTEDDLVWSVVEKQETNRLLDQVIEELPSRQREIVNMRFGLKGYHEKTQKEAAKILGVSQSYISKVEKKIIRSMRKKLESQQNVRK